MKKNYLIKTMIYFIIFISALFIYSLTSYAGVVHEWNMEDAAFANVSKITEDTEIDGLTLHNGISMRESVKLFKGTKLSRYLYLYHSTDINKYSVSFHINGNCTIYILGRSDGVDARKTDFYFAKSGSTKSLYIGDPTGYKLEYDGDYATDVYINSVQDDIRIYSIAVVEYGDEYEALEEGTSYYWDFTNANASGPYTVQTDLAATNDATRFLTINATSEKDVESYSGETTDSGYRFYRGLSLKGTGSKYYRSVAFDVPKNSDIYITARCSSYTTNLYVTNRYECDIEDYDGILQESKIPLSDKTQTYRIRYRGDGERIYLKSEFSAVRLYKIEVASPSNKIINDQSCVFGEYDDLVVGKVLYNTSVDNIQIMSNSSRTASVVAGTEANYNKAINLKSSYFNEASKIIFEVSDSSGHDTTAVNRAERVIRIKAKGDNTNTRLILGNEYGYVYGCYTLESGLKEYVFNYNGGYEKLYLFTHALDSSHNNTEIYSISTSDLQIGGPITYSQNYTAGLTYKFNFTVDNLPNTEEYYYSIKYDDSKLSLLNIGKDYNNSNIITDSNIQIISNKPGEIKFRVLNLNDNNWSGLLSSAVFSAKTSGNSVIKFTTIRG